MTPFERKLQRQSFRQLPAEWRAQILPQAPPVESPKRLSWREWLWPSPLAWAVLAAVWIGVFALGKMAPVSAPPASRSSGELAHESASPLPVLAYRERLLTQLIDQNLTSRP